MLDDNLMSLEQNLHDILMISGQNEKDLKMVSIVNRQLHNHPFFKNTIQVFTNPYGSLRYS